MDDLEQTQRLMERFQAECALCEPGTKVPFRTLGDDWLRTNDPEIVGRHVRDGGNVALMTGRHAGLAVIDPDHLELWAPVLGFLGPPAREWVETGSGRRHSYIRWETDLPAKIRTRDGRIIGELQRGGPDGTRRQAIMLPPSLHPSGRRYRWLVDPGAEPVSPLSPAWRHYLWNTTPPHLRLVGGLPPLTLSQRSRVLR
jgi:Bifunctional DNA primase/polymerase, N-terminal